MAQLTWEFGIEAKVSEAKGLADAAGMAGEKLQALEEETKRVNEELKRIRAPKELERLKSQLEEERTGGGIEGRIKHLNDELRRVKAPEELKRLERELEEHHATGFDKVLGRAKEGIGEFAKEAAGVFTGMLAFEGFMRLAEGAVEFTKEMFHAAEETEKLRISFKYLIGEANVGPELEWLDRLGKVLPGTGDQFAEFDRQLRTVGITSKERIVETLAGASDLAAIAGKDMGSVVYALTEIARTGDVSKRKLSEFGLSVQQALAPLAKLHHKTTEQIQAMLEAGKISGAEAVRSVLQATADRKGLESGLGTAGVELNKTIGYRLEDLHDSWEGLFKTFINNFGPKIGEGLDQLTKALDPESNLGKGISTFLDQIGNSLKNIDWVAGAKNLVAVLEAAVKLVNLIGPHLGVAVELAGDVATGNVGQRKGLHKNTAYGLAAGFFGATMEPESDAKETGKNVAAGLGAGMKAGEGVAAAGGEGVAAAAIDATKTKLDQHSPSRVYEEIGRMSAEGYARGLESHADRVDASIGDMLAIPAPSSTANTRGRGDLSLSAPITIHVQGGDRDVAEEIAHQLRMLPGQLAAAVQQLAIEGGL